MRMKPMKISVVQRALERISMRGAIIGASIFIVTAVLVTIILIY